jgi:glycosyltransferase involved in cell wall biosynthesis
LRGVEKIDLLHLHHKAPSPGEIAWISRLLCDLPCGRQLPVLTHNVFGRNIRRHLQHDGPWLEGVLGSWCKAQLVADTPGMWFRRSAWPIEVPNPQDCNLFRIPSDAERAAARRSLGYAPSDKIILRVGSPIPEKWSSDYIQLAVDAISSRSRLVLLGAPNELAQRITQMSSVDKTTVSVVSTIANDSALRDYYWSADVMAVSAERGESFGNVILEALLCGTPVTYRKAWFRDNTPVQFRPLPGFHYEVSASRWLSRTVEICSEPWTEETASACHAEIAQLYGLDAVASQLSSAARHLTRPRSGAREDQAAYALTPGDWAEVFATHNPALNKLKAGRSALRGTVRGRRAR